MMFLDTSGLFCVLDADEARHPAAANLMLGREAFLTHNYVIAELVALCNARGFLRAPTLDFVEALRADARVNFAWVTKELHNSALDLLRQQVDKRYSLCDAVSFILMRESATVDALTTDHHFEQAGFRRLLA